MHHAERIMRHVLNREDLWTQRVRQKYWIADQQHHVEIGQRQSLYFFQMNCV